MKRKRGICFENRRTRKRLVQVCAPVVTAAFFVFYGWIEVRASHEGLRINEVQVTGGSGKANKDFVELYNDGGASVLIKGMTIRRIKDPGGEFTFSNSVSVVEIQKEMLGSGEYFAWGNKDFFDTTKADEVNGNTLPNTKGIAYQVGIFAKGANVPFSKTEYKNLSDNKEGSWSYKEEDKNWEWTTKTTIKEKNIFVSVPATTEKTLRLSELFPNPKKLPESEYEFIEVLNYGESDISLESGWILQKITEEGSREEKILSGIVGKNSYLALQGGITLNNDPTTVTLLDPDGKIADSVSYGKSMEEWSLAFDGKIWRWTPKITPNKENEFPNNTGSDAGVRLNEIFPNPDGKEVGEFIEFFNDSEKKMDISFWRVRDKSGGSYVFPEGTILASKEFLVITKELSGISLNDAGETVELLDVNGERIDFMAYSSSKEGISWGFDGSRWRASTVLTPGMQNILNGEPQADSVSVPEKGYVNVWVFFSAGGLDSDGDELKYQWNFGDGHKSYKQNTKHRYEEEGKFEVSLRIDDGKEIREETYVIEIESYPHHKVKIVGIEPNPEGKDADGEWVRVKNQSKKTVDLNGWSVATGRDVKHLSNHPIKTSVKIKKGKEAVITRAIAKIALNNKKGVVELRYPNGERSDRVKYGQENGIGEGDVYRKEKKSWFWDFSEKAIEDAKNKTNFSEDLKNVEEKEFVDSVSEENAGDVLEISQSVDLVVPRYAGRNEYNLQPYVLGASSVRLTLDNGRYIFAEGYLSEHYVVLWWRRVKEWMGRL